MKGIIKFILLYFYVYFSFFLMCFVGEWILEVSIISDFRHGQKLILILMIFLLLFSFMPLAHGCYALFIE